MRRMFLIHVIFGAVNVILISGGSGDKVVPLDICVVVVGDAPLFGHVASSAAYDVAVERARQLYPRVFRDVRYQTFYQPGVYQTCEQSAGALLVLVSSLYNSTHQQYERVDSRKLFCLSPGRGENQFTITGTSSLNMFSPITPISYSLIKKNFKIYFKIFLISKNFFNFFNFFRI